MNLLLYALVIALFCWICSSALPMWARWSFYFGAPLISGLLNGVLLNDMAYGLQVGATIQMAYIGLLAIGGSLPNELAIAGYLGVAMTMLSGADASTGLAIATPLGLLGVFCQSAKMALNPIWVHKADQYAVEGNSKGIRRMNLFASQIFPFLTYFIPSFLCVYLGGQFFSEFMAALPIQIMNALKLIGQVMPALGLGMLLQVLYKKSTIPFLIIGFVLATYLAMDMTSIALIGIGLAILHYLYMPKEVE